MVFWGDYTGLPSSYKGWNVFIDGEQNNTKTNFAASLQKLLEWLREYMSVDTVTLLLPVKEQQDLGVYASIGLEEEIEQQIRIPIKQGIAGRIAANKKPMIVDDLSKVEVVSPVLRQKDLKSLVGIPVPLKQDTIGVLHVGTLESHQFTERDIEQLQLVAHRIGLMVTDAELFNVERVECDRGHCFEVFGFKVRTSYFNILHQAFAWNFSTLTVRVLKLAGFYQRHNFYKGLPNKKNIQFFLWGGHPVRP